MTKIEIAQEIINEEINKYKESTVVKVYETGHRLIVDIELSNGRIIGVMGKHAEDIRLGTGEWN